jgi:hypothetical protein
VISTSDGLPKSFGIQFRADPVRSDADGLVQITGRMRLGLDDCFKNPSSMRHSSNRPIFDLTRATVPNSPYEYEAVLRSRDVSVAEYFLQLNTDGPETTRIGGNHHTKT